ncbi:DUF5953 family protein [Melittangium boletus]|uniref:DUF5953 family protein n=1 Tax=Melittangium boletus TaxID=83453 RepID=UPI003DA66BFD
MASSQNDLGLIVYAPPFSGNGGRTLTIVHGMERALPGLNLGWTTSDEEGLRALPFRDEWLVAQGAAGVLPFLCNNDGTHVVTIAGWENPNGLSAEGLPHLEIHADLPLDAPGISAAMDVLEAIADGACAFWGHVTPFDAGVEIAEQTSPTLSGPPAPPRGLPALKLPDAIRAPEIPHRLGWLNYWSAASAHALGFPDPARDSDLISRSRSTATGGWIVQLTQAPLDLDHPGHLDALKRAYERFPEIGGRTVP